jgi:hypothetical protein
VYFHAVSTFLHLLSKLVDSLRIIHHPCIYSGHHERLLFALYPGMLHDIIHLRTIFVMVLPLQHRIHDTRERRCRSIAWHGEAANQVPPVLPLYPLLEGDREWNGVCLNTCKKRSIYRVNIHEPKAHKSA